MPDTAVVGGGTAVLRGPGVGKLRGGWCVPRDRSGQPHESRLARRGRVALDRAAVIPASVSRAGVSSASKSPSGCRERGGWAAGHASSPSPVPSPGITLEGLIRRAPCSRPMADLPAGGSLPTPGWPVICPDAAVSPPGWRDVGPAGLGRSARAVVGGGREGGIWSTARHGLGLLADGPGGRIRLVSGRVLGPM